MKHYDVQLRITVNGFEKDTTNRVTANNETRAIFNGFEAEVHTLEEHEVEAALKSSLRENNYYELQDGDFLYQLISVVELYEVDVVIEGIKAVGLLPKPTMPNRLYFNNPSLEYAIA